MSRIAEDGDIVTCSSPKTNRRLLHIQLCGASMACTHHSRLLGHKSPNRRGKERRCLGLGLILVTQSYWHWDDLHIKVGAKLTSSAPTVHQQCRASPSASHFRKRCLRVSAHVLDESRCAPRSCARSL